MNKTIYVPRNSLIQYCTSVFEKCEVPAEEARTSAEVLVSADQRGIPSHGVARLRKYVIGLQDSLMKPRAEIEILKESPVSLLADAKGSMGAPVSQFMMEKIIEKAETSGMSFGCVRDSNHFGIAAYYAMMALKHDMIGFSMTNTAALGVPTFGRQVMFGTNPIAFAAPADKEKAFVLDMSTTVVTRGKIEVYDREGKDLYPGWAVDKEGKSVSRPGPLLDDMHHRRGGGIVPLGGDSEIFGGHKGYGLAVMVDIMTGVLSGSNWGPDIYDKEGSSARVTHCFGAMKIDLFMDPSIFRSNMDAMLHDLRTQQPADGKEQVYYAGLKEFMAEEQTALRGVPLPENVYTGLLEIGKDLELDNPLNRLQPV